MRQPAVPADVEFGTGPDSYCVPLNRPGLVGQEQACFARAVADGYFSGNGPFTRKCQTLLEQALDVPQVLLTTSCTHALEMAALLLDIQPGDEVILPSFTFVSTANAFLLRGARPVFIDIRPDTLNLDERRLEALITPRTRVIVPVHYAGVGCEMDVILEVARRHNLAVVEDNAHGLFGRYRGQYLGTFGCLATQSFHQTKNFTCGEGGALLINDPQYAKRAEIIWEKGTNRGSFLRGEVDKYSWVDLGSSYLPADLLAAVLLVQLENRERIQAVRQAVWDGYVRRLRDWAAAHGVGLPQVPGHCQQTYHLFYLLLPSVEHRAKLSGHLKRQGIQSAFHYVPLHLSAMGRKWGYRPGDCPVTEDLSERLLRLPFYNDLSPETLEWVCQTVIQASEVW